MYTALARARVVAELSRSKVTKIEGNSSRTAFTPLNRNLMRINKYRAQRRRKAELCASFKPLVISIRILAAGKEGTRSIKHKATCAASLATLTAQSKTLSSQQWNNLQKRKKNLRTSHCSLLQKHGNNNLSVCCKANGMSLGLIAKRGGKGVRIERIEGKEGDKYRLNEGNRWLRWTEFSTRNASYNA